MDESASYCRLLCRRVTPSGVIVDTTAMFPVDEACEADYADAASDSSNFLVVWADNRPGDYDVFGARVSLAGSVLDPDGIPIGRLSSVVTKPLTAFDGKNYLVAWDHVPTDTSVDIYAARVTPAGAVLDPSGIRIMSSNLEPSASDLTFGRTNYLLAWNGWTPDGEPAIGAVRITPAGVMLDTGGNIVAEGPAFIGPACATDGKNWLLVWADDRSGDFDIYAARIDSNGAISPPSGLPVCTASGDQTVPEVVFDGTNFVAFWYDQRPPDPYSLYLARITPDLQVLDPNGVRFSPDVNISDYSVVADQGSYLLMGNEGAVNSQGAA